MTRCLLEQAGLPKKFWGEAIMTANHIQNRVPTQATGTSPYERWHGKLPDLSYFQAFGTTAYILNQDPSRRKLDIKGRKLCFVGYEEGSKAYRMLDVTTNKIVISRDVTFLNQFASSGSATDKLEENTQPIIPAVDEVTLEPQETDETSDPDTDVDEQPDDAQEPQDAVPIRRSARPNKGVPPARLIESAYVSTPDNFKEPSSFEEAKASAQAREWNQAMGEELTSLENHKTWELVDLPPGKKAVGCKWVYKTKRDQEGTVTRFKARLVAQGFTQSYGRDYDETYAPVAKPATLTVTYISR